MVNQKDERVLEFHTKKIMTLLKISGAIPMRPDKSKLFLRLLATLYSLTVVICCVHTIFESLLFVLINIEDIKLLISGLWIKISLLFTAIQLIGIYLKRDELRKLLHCAPHVVTNEISSSLKKYMKRAKVLCHLIIWIYFFISVGASITLEFRTKIFDVEEEEVVKVDDDSLAQLLKSSSLDEYIQEVVKYIHYASFSFFGLFQLVSVMLYINVCCFIQAYADHLTECVPNLVLSSEASSENRSWASDENCEIVDIKYVATMHQYVINLICKANTIFSLFMQLKMWRIILVLCLTANDITDHAEVSRQSLVLAVEFATTMWELFISGWLAETLAEARERFNQEIINQLSTFYEIHSADYTSLQILSYGGNIKYTLHAGPFYKMSHKTFNAIIAVSYSYYSFLKNVKA